MPLIRRLLPTERDILPAHLKRLDSESRHDRFCGGFSDEAIERYCNDIDWIEGILLGWFEEGVLRATVQLVPLGHTWSLEAWAREAELAVTVEPAWQDRGIGTELCRRALLAAQNRALARVKMVCLQENARMQRIVRKLRGRLMYVDGTPEGAVEVPPPSYLSLWEEAFGEGGALLGTLVEQWRPMAPGQVAQEPDAADGPVMADAPAPAA